VDELHPPAALAGLLGRCDWLVIACPLTPETRGLVDAGLIAKLPRAARMINVARGEIVDEPALIAALQSGGIAGAGIDVFEQEPVAPDNPLLTMPNVLVTPHALCWTDECFDAIAREGLGCIADFANGHTPKSVVQAAHDV
jgi:D-3-phosphoglycerate dehydrogenase